MEISCLDMCVCNTGNNLHLVTIVVTDPQKGTTQIRGSVVCPPSAPPHTVL